MSGGVVEGKGHGNAAHEAAVNIAFGTGGASRRIEIGGSIAALQGPTDNNRGCDQFGSRPTIWDESNKMNARNGEPAGALEIATLPADANALACEALLTAARDALASIQEHASVASSAASAAADSQRLAAAAHADAAAKAIEVSAFATKGAATMAQLADTQAVIATKSDHIEEARGHADKVRADLDRTLTSAVQQTTEAEGLKARIQSATDLATTALTSVQTSKALVESEQAAIAASKEVAKASSESLKSLSELARLVDARVAGYEARLKELESQCDHQLATIIDLLPGATSAGLASAFDARRKTFLSPSRKWQWLFVGSVVLLVVLALTGMWHTYEGGKVITYDELLRLWLARAPVVAALVWLALHASRESALAKRLEEDYGYKAAIASSFQGFHEQMSKLGSAVGPDTPLARLCGDTLATIASPPGRIYEKHELTVSPTGELKDVAKAVAGQIGGASTK